MIKTRSLLIVVCSWSEIKNVNVVMSLYWRESERGQNCDTQLHKSLKINTGLDLGFLVPIKKIASVVNFGQCNEIDVKAR